MKNPTTSTLIKVAIVVAVAVVACFVLFGCAGDSEYAIKIDPVTGQGTATLTKVALVVPVVGLKMAEAGVVEPPPGMSLWGIVGLALGGSTLLTSLFPKEQAIWEMLFTPGVPLKQKAQGLAALPLPVINSPPAAHAIIARRRKKSAHLKET